ncbi:MAG TPA: UDP-N-acetylmuramoyl-L-alanine--D-glutamate ligase [Kiritimatiellia bacterium]|nr:UDP-N-acetylmuramoyl-L-alanine--D-glutamate ligase [Kiritimatiellia bacterium]
MNNKRQNHCLVLGYGASGKAAARLLIRQGERVLVTDEGAGNAGLMDGVMLSPDLTDEMLPDCKFAVVSPGIPAGHAWLTKLSTAGVPVVPEFEFGLSYIQGVRIVAVTGSNGKSSLVKWLADTLNMCGKSAVPAGNYGTPVSEIAAQDQKPDYLVLELSSFQLEQAKGTFHPHAAILLNIVPNHLDRHETMVNYIKAKSAIFNSLAPGGMAVAHAPAWSVINAHVSPGVSPVLFENGISSKFGFKDGWIIRDGKPVVDLSETWWGRYPLGVNVAAGVAVLLQEGVDPHEIRRSAANFRALPHRLEVVAEHEGVKFVNDSKASTLSAMAAALSTGGEKKHLIAGGILKETDVSFVKELLVKNCLGVYAIGSCAEKLVSSWHDTVPCVNCGDLATAFKSAVCRVRAGEMVLLSPGCSSFDQFAGFFQRGDKFKELVSDYVRCRKKIETTTQGVCT